MPARRARRVDGDVPGGPWQAVADKMLPGFISARAKIWAGCPVDKACTQNYVSGSGVKDLAKGSFGPDYSKGIGEGKIGSDEWMAKQLEGLNVSDHDVTKRPCGRYP